MTIKEAVKKGIKVECESGAGRWGDVEVRFYNSQDDRFDSTSFDIENPLCKSGISELDALYKDFCKDNGIPSGTVEGISLLHAADTYDELVHIC